MPAITITLLSTQVVTFRCILPDCCRENNDLACLWVAIAFLALTLLQATERQWDTWPRQAHCSCISYLFLHNGLLHNLVTQNNSWVRDSFVCSKWQRCSWLSHLSSLMGNEISKGFIHIPGASAGMDEKASLLCFPSSARSLTIRYSRKIFYMVVGSQEGNSRNCQAPWGLDTQLAQHHFCHILLVLVRHTVSRDSGGGYIDATSNEGSTTRADSEGIIGSHVHKQSTTVSYLRWRVTLVGPKYLPEVPNWIWDKGKEKNTKNKSKTSSFQVIDLEGYKCCQWTFFWCSGNG